MKIKRCGNCGSKEVQLKNQKGRPFPWKDYPAVFLSKRMEFLECDLCHELILSERDTEVLDKALRESISEQTKAFIEIILEREECTQTELANHLGISKEYLSEIKSGRTQAGFQTFNFLKTLALESRSFPVSDPHFDLGHLKKAAV